MARTKKNRGGKAAPVVEENVETKVTENVLLTSEPEIKAVKEANATTTEGQTQLLTSSDNVAVVETFTHESDLELLLEAVQRGEIIGASSYQKLKRAGLV